MKTHHISAEIIASSGRIVALWSAVLNSNNVIQIESKASYRQENADSLHLNKERTILFLFVPDETVAN
jgi:hypothetical protein